MGTTAVDRRTRRGQPGTARLLAVALAAFLRVPADAQPVPPAHAQTASPADASGAGLIARSSPRVVYRGGPFLRRPRIVTITFEGDDPALVARLEQFGKRITRTAWWREATDGYCAGPHDCIGECRHARHVQLKEAMPDAVRDLDVEALLARAVQAGRFGPPDPDTLLLTYLPAGVRLSDAFVPGYCGAGPRAYHRALRLGKLTVAYAALPRCGGEAELTATASHEILEATTNPDPAARGFAFEQESANLGFTAAGVEPVDPCGLLTMGTHWTMPGGFVVQRAWSNRAASLGRDPCVPSRPGRPYVALVPREPTVRLVQEGERATIILEAAADRPVPAWSVSAVDHTGFRDGEPCVEVSLDRSNVTAGETASLTITMRKRNGRRLCVVGVVSTLGIHSYMWPVAVVMR